FQTHLAAILDKLTKAALVEIGNLADECSSVLHTEISLHKTENEALKKRCYSLEVQIDGVFGKDWCMDLWREEPALDLMERDPDLIFVKEELYDDDSQTHRMQPTIMDKLIDDATMNSLVDNPNLPASTGEYSDYANNIHFNATKELIIQPKPMKPTKRFECLFCGKIFNYLSSLKVHIRRHSGEKPFSCSVCGRRFAQKTYLKLHQRVHSGEKPYSCPDCGKSFSQKSSLNIHLRTHTGEKPYSCVDCGKCYAYKYGLNHHQCFN
uniref:Si:dkey-210j14.3 n=1 Tax=Labrus bergylta TaxID=56723 RepID=A0A3Q3GBJ9_9LABR